MNGNMLETFIVYRSLHSDESWGAVLGGSPISNLPNADFVMKVFARNEKEAISRARLLYEAIHKYDSDRDNIRRFACAALKSVVAHDMASGHNPEEAAICAMEYALKMNEEFTKHFEVRKQRDRVNELIEEAEQERLDGEEKDRQYDKANSEHEDAGRLAV